MLWQTYPVFCLVAGITAGVVVMVRMVCYLYKKAGILHQNGKIATWGWPVSCFFLFGLAVFGKLGQYPLRWSDAYNLGSDFNANLALNPFQSFFSSLSFRTHAIDEVKLRQYYPVMADYLEVSRKSADALQFKRTIAPAGNGAGFRPNVVLVICESFSAYKSSMWGNPLNTTPYFDQLCRQGIFFDNCFTPHFGTARGIWATITGIPDVERIKTASRNPAMVDQHTIINDFRGYQKLYFLGGSASWANIRGLLTANISNLGLFEKGSYQAPEIDVWGISDKNLFLEANNILKQRQQPFFAIIQTADNHRPYTISTEDRQAFVTLQYPPDTLKKYGFESNDELNAFRYTDFGYRKFMEAARQCGYYQHTVFIFVGDHGIKGDAGKMFPPAWTDNGLTAYHVPLLFYAPAWLPPRRIHTVASQIDVLPTAAGLANIDYTNTTLGRDLLQTKQTDNGRNNIAFIMDYNHNNIGIIKGDYYYTCQPSGALAGMVWADFRHPAPEQIADSLRNAYDTLANAFYETARYMLLNNKKRYR